MECLEGSNQLEFINCILPQTQFYRYIKPYFFIYDYFWAARPGGKGLFLKPFPIPKPIVPLDSYGRVHDFKFFTKFSIPWPGGLIRFTLSLALSDSPADAITPSPLKPGLRVSIRLAMNTIDLFDKK